MRKYTMEKYEIERIRALPIEGVAQRLGLNIQRHRCLCCFHDDHNPSMSFNVAKNTFRCWSCGAHGSVIDLALKLLPSGKGSFVEACQWLADGSLSLTLPRREGTKDDTPKKPFDASRYERYFEHPWLSADACKFLFDTRHLHPAVVRFCRLNSFRDWLQIPYYDTQGKLIGIQQRYMGTDPNQPRFRFPRGEQCHLYNQQIIPMLRPAEPLYLGEGPSDVWALLSSGKKALGIPSATLLKTADLKLLEPLKHLETPLHIYPDKDEAGEALYRKLLSAANKLGLCIIRHNLPEGCKDFSDYWARDGAKSVENLSTGV